LLNSKSNIYTTKQNPGPNGEKPAVGGPLPLQQPYFFIRQTLWRDRNERTQNKIGYLHLPGHCGKSTTYFNDCFSNILYNHEVII
jgi:hypothetical protein